MTGLYVVGGIILLLVGVIVAAYMRGRSAGADRITAKVAEKTADVLRKQDKAGAEGPRTEQDVVDRLRKGGF